MIAQLLPSFNERVWTGSQKKVEAFSYLEVDLYHPCLCQAVVEHTLDSGALSDLDDVWDILQWRKNDGEIAPTAEHEPLHADLLYIAHIKFADIATSDLPFCPGLGNMVVKAQTALFVQCISKRLWSKSVNGT